MTEDVEFSGVNHISMTVRDMEASLHFYRDMVGLKLLTDISVDEPPDRPVEQYRSRHPKRRFVTLDTGGGPSLALITHPGSTLKARAFCWTTSGSRISHSPSPTSKGSLNECWRWGPSPPGPAFSSTPTGSSSSSRSPATPRPSWNAIERGPGLHPDTGTKHYPLRPVRTHFER